MVLSPKIGNRTLAIGILSLLLGGNGIESQSKETNKEPKLLSWSEIQASQKLESNKIKWKTYCKSFGSEKACFDTFRKKVNWDSVESYYQREKMGISSEDAMESKREDIQNRIAWTLVSQELQWELVPSPTKISRISPSIRYDLGLVLRKGSRKSLVVVEWLDLDCAFCRKSAIPNSKIRKQWKDLLWVQKFKRLDSQGSSVKLRSLLCYHDKNPKSYWENSHLLFDAEKRQDLVPENCRNLGPEEYSLPLQAMEKEAQELGVSALPTYNIQGYWVQGSLTEEGWSKVFTTLRQKSKLPKG